MASPGRGDDAEHKEATMHPLGSVLTPIHHQDELRRAEAFRAWHREPDALPLPKAETKPSFRDRLMTAFAVLRHRPIRI